MLIANLFVFMQKMPCQKAKIMLSYKSKDFCYAGKIHMQNCNNLLQFLRKM